jgi:molybdopterin synthase sulfur carrier subunit
MVSVVGVAVPSVGTIRILLFAELRERAGWGEHHWPTNPGCAAGPTPRELWLHLELSGELDPQVRIAINREFADADTPLQPGDELAFLPPISGG